MTMRYTVSFSNMIDDRAVELTPADLALFGDQRPVAVRHGRIAIYELDVTEREMIDELEQGNWCYDWISGEHLDKAAE